MKLDLGISIHADIRDLERLFSSLASYVNRLSLISSRIIVDDIQNKTKKGNDASNRRFTNWTPRNESDRKRKAETSSTVYSPSQHVSRVRQGAQTGKKDLKVHDNGMLASLGLRGSYVTVSSEYESIAHGQMFHPKWRYHHEFLLAGNDTMRRIENRILSDINLLR